MHHFSSSRRLTKKAEFNHVFNRAQKLVCGRITLLFKPNTLAYARLGFAISKRFAKRAVLRNKIRRTIKESFRHQTNLPAYDMVVLLNQACDKQNADLIHKHIEQLWQKLN